MEKTPFHEFGAFITSAMEARGVTSGDLAQAAKVSVRAIERIKSGKRLAGWRMCLDMAPTLGVTPDALAEEMGRYVPSIEEMPYVLRHSVALEELKKDPATLRTILEARFADMPPDERERSIGEWLAFGKEWRDQDLKHHGDLPPAPTEPMPL